MALQAENRNTLFCSWIRIILVHTLGYFDQGYEYSKRLILSKVLTINSTTQRVQFC
jgi:hypothetical protein